MATMPIVPVRLPSAAAAQHNGAIPQSLMASPDDRTGLAWLLWHTVALQMRVMHFAARIEAGIRLSSTGRYRTLYGQWTIFGGNSARYEPCTYAQYVIALPLGRGKKWTAAARAQVAADLLAQGYRVSIPDATYWRKKLVNGSWPATAAVPATSNHGFAGADDLAELSTSGAVIPLTAFTLQWLYANERRFGFAHETKKEPWHVHTIAGDTVPPEVSRYLACAAAPTLGEGSTGNHVRWYQACLNNHGLSVTADGLFGPKTRAATIEFQRSLHLAASGTVDLATWWMATR